MSEIAATTNPVQSTNNPIASRLRERVLSVDALRGVDMFWIIGADELVRALGKFSDSPVVQFFRNQMIHKEWQGFAFYDLIFPLFVFLVGVSMVFSLGRVVAEQGRAAAYRKIFVRALILFLLGILYSGGLSQPWPEIRLLGVLQRIALSYFFAGLIFCTFGLRTMIGICVSLLVGYWAIMTFVPMPGLTEVSFAERQNIANWIDQEYLPGKKFYGSYDPEGLLSALPAIAGCLLGVFAGLLLKDVRVTPQRKVFWLLGAGTILLVLGYVWGLQFPIIKKVWTSSYVLVTAGWSAVALAVFYQVIDVWKYQRWCTPFVWIGLNPITIYLAYEFIDFGALARRFVGGDIQKAMGPSGELLIVAVAIGFGFLLAWFLNRKKIYLRV